MTNYFNGVVVRSSGARPAVAELRLPEIGPGQVRVRIRAALLGCGGLPGTGAVGNTARVAPGESVVVIGLGGVGLSVVAAARAAGATEVIAVDVSEAKKALAEAAGATDFVVSSDALSK